MHAIKYVKAYYGPVLIKEDLSQIAGEPCYSLAAHPTAILAAFQWRDIFLQGLCISAFLVPSAFRLPVLFLGQMRQDCLQPQLFYQQSGFF